MPLRPIDAIFIHPERRLYVVYYRGALWQLPRMKIDESSWQRRQPYKGDMGALYLSSHQFISDPLLAAKLRTLNLPAAIRGSTLPRFEAWWETQGFDWLKGKLEAGQSPLAVHSDSATIKDNQSQPKVDPNDDANHINQSAQHINNGSQKDDLPARNTPPSSKHKSDVQKNDIKHSANQDLDKKTASTDVFSDMLADLTEEVLHQQL